MKILLVSTMVPYLPCRDGFRIIPANVLLRLSKRHEIHLVALTDGSEEAGQRDWSLSYCQSVTLIPAEGNLSLTPRGGRSARTALERLLADVMRDVSPDILHVEGASLAPVARVAPPSVFRLLSAHDSLRLRFTQFAQNSGTLRTRLRFRALAVLARRYERRWYRGFHQIVVTSESDKHAIQESLSTVPVDVTPNGVDLDFFHFNPTPERDHVVFTGNLSWPPNEDAACHFATEILPRFVDHRKGVRFSIVGANPSPRVLALGGLPGVQVVGSVPDIRPWIWKAAVYVSPLRFGAGIKNKILEAMALGAPVVASPTSFSGTSIIAGLHALVSEEPEEFACVVERLLDNEGERKRLSLAGRGLVEHSYTWESAARSFEAYYERANTLPVRSRATTLEPTTAV